MLFIYTLESVRMIYTFKYVRVNTPSKVFIGITPLEMSGYFTPLKKSGRRSRCSVHIVVLNLGLALCLSAFTTVVPGYPIPVCLSRHSSDSVYLSSKFCAPRSRYLSCVRPVGRVIGVPTSVL